MAELRLDLASLRAGYLAGRLDPVEVLETVLRRADAAPERHVWVARLAAEAVLGRAQALRGRRAQDLPLYGVPFAIKDNIDLEGVPTTAACADFAYLPERSAPVVERLIAAGAVPIGKTNLDQFATGLVGTRSPYGACRNAFHPEFISGGSSSGSAVAVASGIAAFALGTDTAGSGRVPAAFNNLIGLKPTRGLLSTRGVVPACRSLDCVSVFALTADDARAVLAIARGFDPLDPYARRAGGACPGPCRLPGEGFRFALPRTDQLRFFGDREYQRLFAATLERLERLGGRPVEIDFEPFLEAARLLYQGPWLAERYAAVGAFLEAHPQALHPVTRRVIAPGRGFSAVQAFVGEHRRRALSRATDAVWERADLLVTPTTGTIYRIAEVEAEPVELNSRLGYYTNFVNLLDLAAVAVPAGFRDDGLPFGVTLAGPAFCDEALLELAGRLHVAGGLTLGSERPGPGAAAPTGGAGDRGARAGGGLRGAHERPSPQPPAH